VARPERAELPIFWVVTMADYVFAEITPDKRASVHKPACTLGWSATLP